MPPLLEYIQGLIIDADGVLWRGAKPLPGVAEFFAFLNRRGIRFLVATNNATRPPESLVERLAAMHVIVSPEQILTSAKATALYLKQELPAGSRVLVVGEEGLLKATSEAGFSVKLADTEDDDQTVKAVVVGLDRGFTYQRLRGASSAIRAGAKFIATNTDATFPGEDGLVPGAGSIVASVQTATSVAPTVIGKPYRPMFNAALELLRTIPESTGMLGDRLDTDIEGAKAVGLTTMLVLTGVTTPEEAALSSLKPDFTFANLTEGRNTWEEALERRVH